MGGLILRWASRLDAFSGYPIQTWLISSALGRTTDTPEVRSSRSSRTRDDSSQSSNPHDATSRHRGAKPFRRCGLLGRISLLSPEYLLSVERRHFHLLPPDHYGLLSHLLELSVSQSSSLMPLRSTHDFQPC